MSFDFVQTSIDFFKRKNAVAYYNKDIKHKINANINFGSQDKDLDVIFKVGNNFIFLEAKHIKESGGAQDKQIKELIGLLNINLPINIFIVSFMDGVYSNHLLDIEISCIENPEALVRLKNKTKLSQQQYEILKGLKNNQNSFWVNTYGLIELIKDLNNEN